MEILTKLKENVVLGRMNKEDEGLLEDMRGERGVCELIQEGIDNNINIKELIDALTSGMEEVGRKYETGEYFIPDMLAAAEAVGAGMDILEPYLIKEGIEKKGKFVIGTVKGDLHDIGKNIVAIMLKGAGFTVFDLGSNVDKQKIVDTIKKEKPQLVGLSALLTTTMGYMQEVINELKKENLRENVKVLIGGAPISEAFAKKIGADAYCADAFKGVEKASEYSRVRSHLR